MKFFSLFAISVVLLMAAPAKAVNKVETIRDLVRAECKTRVAFDAALAMIRPLYLTCVPGTKVNVSKSCSLDCLKAWCSVAIV